MVKVIVKEDVVDTKQAAIFIEKEVQEKFSWVHGGVGEEVGESALVVVEPKPRNKKQRAAARRAQRVEEEAQRAKKSM